jgi:hypothetical protein
MFTIDLQTIINSQCLKLYSLTTTVPSIKQFRYFLKIFIKNTNS